MKVIQVPLPLNITDENLHLYQPYSTYNLATIAVKKLQEVFITFTGFCMDSTGLVKECHHDNPLQYNDYLNEAAKYYYDVSDNPENLITLDDDKTYLAIHHPWFNYYHWIAESIFRLWMVKDELDDLVLVLPDFYKDADFIMGSLEPFGIKNIFFIPQGKSLLVQNLCLPQLKPVCDSFYREDVLGLRKFYREYVQNVKKLTTTLGRRIYISRELAPRRKVINEAAVVSILERYGFVTYFPEKHSFLEQVSIFSQANYVVSTHGSGLTNMLFMEEGSTIIELHKNKTNELDHPSCLFWYLAEALSFNYLHQLCATQGPEDYFTGDYIVDIILLEQNLQLIA